MFPRVAQILIVALVLALMSPQPATAELPDMIIRNAMVHNSDGGTSSVDIRISKGLIAEVSENSLSGAVGVLFEDADGGYVLGDLDIGKPPRFIIVDDNPLKNFAVLQNTAAHTIFSVDGDKIVRNTLKVSVENTTHDQDYRGWIGHAPPPVLVDRSHSFDDKWNAFETEHFTGLFSIGLFMDRAFWLSQNEASRNQPGVGDLTDYDGGTIRALRFGLDGSIKFAKPWHYSLWIATNAFDSEYDPDSSDEFKWFDYRLDIPLAEQLTFSIGRQKEPISLPRLMTLTWNPMQERTAAENAMMPSRNFGIAFSGHGFDQRFTWGAGVFNDWIESSESFEDHATQYVGRVSWLPMISRDEEQLIHLGLGIRYDDAKQGLRFSSVPEVHDAPLFVDTGQFAANSATLLNLEASWRRGPVWLFGEFQRNEIDAPDLGNPTLDGYHIVASWSVTGEVRPYNRRSGVFGPLPVARDIRHGGHGALELVLRWSEIDLTDGALEGGEMQVARAAATWWAHSGFNISLNYQKIWNDWAGSKGEADSIVVRLMLFSH